MQIFKVHEGTTLKNRAYVTLVHNMPPVMTNDLVLIIWELLIHFVQTVICFNTEYVASTQEITYLCSHITISF